MFHFLNNEQKNMYLLNFVGTFRRDNVAASVVTSIQGFSKESLNIS